MNTPTTQPIPQKPLPQLIKKSSTYKLIVPQPVEEKIRYLIRKYPSTEWSGILFYTHEGSFEDNNLILTCQDIFPMDLGTSGWTEFHMNEDVAAYIAENIDLFNCEMGLVHSHHLLGAFFSGQDNKMLQQEGDDTNCFVSLIVDTKGTYVAAITRKIKTTSEITTKEISQSYEFFGEGSIALITSKDPVSKISSKEIIECYSLEVERHEVPNSLDYLDTRFTEIVNKKKTAKDSKKDDFWNRMASSRETNKPYQTSLFNESSDFQTFLQQETPYIEEHTQPNTSWIPDKKLIHQAVVRMITCSLIINPNSFDLNKWINNHMKKVYEGIFGNEDEIQTFTEWKDFIIGFILDHFEDPSMPKDISFESYCTSVAEAMHNEISSFTYTNPYIYDYCATLEEYMENT